MLKHNLFLSRTNTRFIAFSLLTLLWHSLVFAQGTTWSSRTSAADNNWQSVAYGAGLFVTVASSGTGNRVMTSPDGSTWTIRTSPADNAWNSVIYANSKFVAVAGSGTNRVMTSTDGITWTASASADEAIGWSSIAYGNGIFVATSNSANNKVMTSTDGVTWTLQTTPTNLGWLSITYGNGTFVALSSGTSTTAVITSTDGTSWTTRNTPNNRSWQAVTFGNNLFVAVANTGDAQRVMTSPDGITWTTYTAAASNNWRGITYGNGVYVAVSASGTGNRVMTSTDGETWTARTSAADISWRGITYSNGIFVAAAYSGAGNRVMTSGTFSPLPVKWASFTVKPVNGNNELIWKTASEAQNHRFEVERSADGLTFNKIGEVPAAPNATNGASYAFTDKTFHQGTNYYRLKQIDMDGKFDYSSTIHVNTTQALSFSLYPNPVTHALKIKNAPLSDGKLAYIISNGAGQQVLSGILPADKSISVQHLTAGRYFLKIGNVSQAFIKQ